MAEENLIESEIEAVLSENGEKFEDKKFVSISNCEISENFPRNLSNFLPNLESLRVTKTKLRTLRREAFDGLESLRHLSFDSNMIDWIFPDAFEGIKNLESLFLSNNKIELLHPSTFSKNLKLKSIWVDYNKIEELSSELFENNKNLEWISFAHNRIKKIEINFRALSKLFYGNFEKNFDGCDVKFEAYLKNEEERREILREFEEKVFKFCA